MDMQSRINFENARLHKHTRHKPLPTIMTLQCLLQGHSFITRFHSWLSLEGDRRVLPHWLYCSWLEKGSSHIFYVYKCLAASELSLRPILVLKIGFDHINDSNTVSMRQCIEVASYVDRKLNVVVIDIFYYGVFGVNLFI